MSEIKCFFVEEVQPMEVDLKVKDKKIAKINEVNINAQIGNEKPVYRRTDTGEEFDTRVDFPVGAMWFANWYDEQFNPQLEHTLAVRTPDGDWVIDSQSSNCTKKTKLGNHRQQDHHCWIIEGDLPDITVSKKGNSCSNGDGSIQIGNYHGFLQNGYLVEI